MIDNENHKQQRVHFACLLHAKASLGSLILAGPGHDDDDKGQCGYDLREPTRVISDALTIICNVLFRKVTRCFRLSSPPG